MSRADVVVPRRPWAKVLPKNAHDPLADLQQWYVAQCDGEWEHGVGVTIETLDNPG